MVSVEDGRIGGLVPEMSFLNKKEKMYVEVFMQAVAGYSFVA